MQPAGSGQNGYAFNRTRGAFLANELAVADSHWTRLKGLLGTAASRFHEGKGLWIVPSHGVHTLGMRYAIDVVYIGEDHKVVRVEENVRPWRVTAISLEAETVLELPRHTVARTRTEVGDEIEIRMDHVPGTTDLQATEVQT